jgi:hypothetical protein
MLVVNRRMNTIKQPSKRDNVHQSPPSITQLSNKNDSKNVIKNVFNVDLHHHLIREQVKEGLDAKKDDLIASRG